MFRFLEWSHFVSSLPTSVFNLLHSGLCPITPPMLSVNDISVLKWSGLFSVFILFDSSLTLSKADHSLLYHSLDLTLINPTSPYFSLTSLVISVFFVGSLSSAHFSRHFFYSYLLSKFCIPALNLYFFWALTSCYLTVYGYLYLLVTLVPQTYCFPSKSAFPCKSSSSVNGTAIH